MIDINSESLQNVDRSKNTFEHENLTVTNEIYDLKTGKHQITEEIKIQKAGDLTDSKSTKTMKVRIWLEIFRTFFQYIFPSIF